MIKNKTEQEIIEIVEKLYSVFGETKEGNKIIVKHLEYMYVSNEERSIWEQAVGRYYFFNIYQQ